MNTDEHGLRSGGITQAVIGCAMEVLNALVVELRYRYIACQQQPRFNVTYRGVTVGEYVPDLIVAAEVVVDTKVIDRITDHELGQMLNYLKITGLHVGLILNFKRSKLEWKRVVL